MSGPVSELSDLISVAILANGAAVDSSYQVYSVEVVKTVNRISSATIVLLDGDAASETFPISDSSDFIPGTAITIKAGYHEDEAVIFSGIIIKHALKVRLGKATQLILDCKDDAVKMTVGRNNAIFENTTDSDAIGTVISKHGLAKSVDSTSYVNKELVQYYCSDWDFVVSRAEINGLIVLTDQGKTTVCKPDSSQSSVLTLTYGDDILTMDVQVDALSQYSSVQASSWDMTGQALLTATAADPGVTTPGNFSPATLAGVSGVSSINMQSTSPLEQTDIQNWADACLLKSRFAMLRGQVKFQGSALAIPGAMIGIAGAGDRFNGNAIISGVFHQIEKGNWYTTVELGLDLDWFAAREENIQSPPASGILPGISGLQNGVVKQINADPDNAFRVLVTIPVLDNKTVWARLANLYATNTAGSYFYPEVGDEVVLGFFNDDPRFPVILGSLYSSANAPPYTPDEPNTTKAIVSKSQIKIVIDEEKKSLTLVTPANNTIVISDDAKSIKIDDQHGNKIEMSESGITIDSASDLILKAAKNITATATAAISATATTDLKLAGLTVTGEAQTQMVMKGNATGEFSASGMVTVKGGIVMIN